MRGVNLCSLFLNAVGALSWGGTVQLAKTIGREGVFRLVCAICLVVLLPCAHAQAGLLPFALDPNEVSILGIDGSLTYTASTGELQSTMTALVYSPAPNPEGFSLFGSGDTITVDLFVTQSGGFSANGAGITITGSLDLDGDGTPDVSGTLLTGSLTDFGAQAAGPPTWVSNALFTVNGGLLTTDIALSGGGSYFGGFTLGEQAGLFLYSESVTSGTLGDFTQNFGSDSVKVEVGLPVPEPAAWIQAVSGLVGLATFMACKRRHSGSSVIRLG
jgi:hypothetical protein